MALDLGTKAYVAGVIDMSGIIRVRKTHTKDGVSELPYVGLSTPNQQVVEFLAGLTDSRVTTTRRNYTKTMCTEHCTPDAHTHVVSESYRWSVSGVKATVLLANIKPYLVFQTVEAEKALKVGQSAGFKPATYRRMARIGWEVPETVLPQQPKPEDQA